MTVLNDLRRQANAQPQPKELTIAYNHLGSLVEHIHAVRFGGKNMGRTLIRSELMRGEMRLCGVPIRVLGVPFEVRQAYIDALTKRRIP